MGVCQFVYCFLSRTRKVGSLPELNKWEEYMDAQKIDEFESIATVDFQRNLLFGSTLRDGKD